MIQRRIDRLQVELAVRAHGWAERTIARVRGKRGRDFIGPAADVIDCRRGDNELRDARMRQWGRRFREAA